MELNRIYQGDARELAKLLPDNSISVICTSPPFFQLRDYMTGEWLGGLPDCNHKPSSTPQERGVASSTLDGGKGSTGHRQEGYRATCARCGAKRVDAQMGLEPSPSEFVAELVALFRELRRALHPSASLWCNMGDSYRDKQLLGMPWRLAFALQDDGWILRSEITLCKRAPMPESVRDRFTSATEKLFMLTKQANYYFDSEAIREPNSEGSIERFGITDEGQTRKWHTTDNKRDGRNDGTKSNAAFRQYVPNGRNARNYILLSPEPSRSAHYAAYPSAIPRLAILAGSSAYGVCSNCLAPYERVTERTGGNYAERKANGAGGPYNLKPELNRGKGHIDASIISSTIGWQPTCSCDAPVQPATVLDPFAGSGTTCAVGVSLGRSYIGFELNPDYVEMARQRVAETQPALLAE